MHNGPRQLSRYSDWLRAGLSVDRIPVGSRFSAPVQTGPGPHPTSCTMGTGSFLGVKSSWGMMLTPHPILGPWSWMSRAIPLLSLWAIWPVQSLSACTRVHFIFFYLLTPDPCTVAMCLHIEVPSCERQALLPTSLSHVRVCDWAASF